MTSFSQSSIVVFQTTIILNFKTIYLILEQIYLVRIVTYKRITEFIEEHNDSKSALQDWYYKTIKANWVNVSDIKNTFNHVDYVGNCRVVFNVKGNQYRLVAIVIFASKKVYIRFIGTHAEYDKIDCATI